LTPHPQPLSQAWERGARGEQEGSKRGAREEQERSKRGARVFQGGEFKASLLVGERFGERFSRSRPKVRPKDDCKLLVSWVETPGGKT